MEKLAMLICIFALLVQCTRPTNLHLSRTKSVTGSPSPAWPDPENTFVLPLAFPDHIYYIDIQASFPDVDWQSLDRLYIPAGDYDFINISNLPVRSADRPLIITNYEGQVRVGAGHHYTCSINGGSNWVLTGRYSKTLKTGDVNYQGHAYGAYANSSGTYGIEISHSAASGIGIGGRATDFELDFIEVGHTGFAGLLIKTNNDPTATMDNIKIHDLYIHDTESEGVYIGNTAGDPNTQHKITNMKFYNNRILRSGTEGLQLVNMGPGNEIFNNVVLVNALTWKDAFQLYQDGLLGYTCRDGSSSIHHNIFIGGANHLFIMRFSLATGESADGETDVIHIHDNYFSHSRDFFGYISNHDSNHDTRLRFENNYISNINFHYNEIKSGYDDPNTIFRASANKLNPQDYISNHWDGTQKFIDWFSETNMTDGNVTSENNVNAKITPMTFKDSGLPDDFDYHLIERWVDHSTLYDIDVYYNEGDYVMHEETLYKCIEAGTHTGKTPPEYPGTWQQQPAPVDDVRLPVNSPYKGMGLLDTLAEY